MLLLGEWQRKASILKVKLIILNSETKLEVKLTLCAINKGDCKNNSCKAYEHRVIVPWGYRDFDFFQDEHKSRCPLCNKYVTTVTCGFSDTFWKCEGSKRVDGNPPEEVN